MGSQSQGRRGIKKRRSGLAVKGVIKGKKNRDQSPKTNHGI